MDICLVNMPYSEIPRPSLALGILQSAIAAEGYSAVTLYANLLFAEEIGIVNYGYVSKSRPQEALTDWTFAHIAFPEFTPDPEAYIDLLIRRHWIYRRIERNQFRDDLFLAREKASRFMDTLANRILNMNPCMVGCSTSFLQHVPSLGLLRRIRELAPEVVTLLGGANCETVMGRGNHRYFTWLDFVVSGEADGLIGKLVRDIKEKGRDLPITSLPEGVFAPIHRRVGYPVHPADHNANDAPRAVFQNLKDQPVPHYDDYFDTIKTLPVIKEMILPGLPIETSRGCWWGQSKGCKFCGLNGHDKRFRSKPGEAVIREMFALSERYQLKRLQPIENIMDMRYFKTLLPELKRAGKPFSLFFEVKSNLRRHHVKALREAGVIWFQPGIESLNTEVLDLMQKGAQAWHNIQILKWAREFGLRAQWFILYGFPGENDAWYQEMVQLVPLITHLMPPVNLNRINYGRFSHYQENAPAYGLNLAPPRPFYYIYPLEPEQLREITYFFEDEGQEDMETHPVLSALLWRSGLAALRREVADWIVAFNDGKGSRLTMDISSDGVTVIQDTRACATAPSHTLSVIERDIYLTCDEAPKADELMKTFADRGLGPEDVQLAVKHLLDLKVMVAVDGRFLALATREPLRELPNRNEYPGGITIWPGEIQHDDR
jgi:ribosomal peptide maturation radical SAM protein 1